MKRYENAILSCKTTQYQTSKCASDCVICTKEAPDSPGVKIEQVIEGLVYHRRGKRGEILLLFLIHNPNRNPTAFRIVHRGNVSAELRPFSFSFESEALETIKSLYSERIREKKGDPQTALFHKRINCLSASLEPVEASLLGPSRCFENGHRSIPLDRDFPASSAPSFSSFLVPALDPGERVLFTVSIDMDINPYLPDDPPFFSVDSYTRLVRDILAYDVPNATPQGRDLFLRSIEPKQYHLAPDAYDIVIFQQLGDPVVVSSESICIVRVRPDNEELAAKVLWFFGKPVDEFYMVLSYARDGSNRADNSGFAIPCSQDVSHTPIIPSNSH
jgi:hypothetical protein